ncbi:MAG: hypothetical protein RL199_908 [Pseudomonadota bacterium]
MFARTRRRLAALVAGSFVFVFCGCGYTLGAGSGLSTLHNDRPVEVGRVENASFEPDAGPLVVRALSRALPSRVGRTSAETALVVDGTVESVRTLPVGFVGPQNVQLWRVEVRLQLRLVDRPAATLTAKSSVTEAEEYRAAADLEATEVSRRLALERAATRAAENGLDRLAK